MPRIDPTKRPSANLDAGGRRRSRVAVRFSASRLAQIAATIGLLLQPIAPSCAFGQGVSSPAAPPAAGGDRPSPDAWPKIVRPPAGAPNVLLIMTDDVGFGATSAFGGPIPTPNLDALAKRGLRYNRFHTASICSPTRASLLTGREPHKVSMGNVNNLATGYDGYTSVIPDNAGMVAETLRVNGYVTAAFGKWHLTPEWEQSSIGPFDRWPTGEGFQYFYGFHGGDTDQFAPSLFQNTLPVAPPTDDPDYIFDRDMADKAIGWIRQQRDISPDHPFFVYMAPGTAHSAHSAPKEWIDKFKGQFDAGWDVLRAESFKRQKAMGIIPTDARLTPRPAFLPAWKSLGADRKRVYARMMECYAAALAFNDHEVGRVIDSLERNGELDNTLVIFIQGDNGASAEGGPQGLFAEETMINGYREDFAAVVRDIDKLGGPLSRNHYPAMWAWALNSPFQYYKQVASHLGGNRNGMVVAWPKRIKQGGAIRDQFLFVSDVAPTILEAAGIAQPEALKGMKQMPIDGISFAYSFTEGSAPSRRRTQVFETMQNVAIYHDGWWAGTRPEAAPWDITTKSMDVALDRRSWELYDLSKDFSQSRDLAAGNSARLAELKQLFYSEAAKYKILPVHGISDGAAGRPSLTEGRTSFTYRTRMSRVAESAAPRIIGRSFQITADIGVPASGANGVLVTQGGRFGGYSFYLKDGVPIFHYNMIGDMQYVIRAQEKLAAGPHQLTARFEIDEPKNGAGGTLTILADGKPVGSGRIEHTHRTWISNSEGFDVGEDTLTPIGDDYQIADSRFTGDLKQVRIDLK